MVAVLGGDTHPDERLADRRHMRHLRCYGDVAIGAQTLREQPELVQTPQAPGDEPMPALARFRVAHGLPVQPRHVIYSRRGDLDLDLPVFRTPGVEVLVVTTAEGAAAQSARGAAARGVTLVAEPVSEPAGLRRAHARLFAEHGVRYLDCEGGQRMLDSLHAADLLDEVFLTETDTMVDESAARRGDQDLRLRARRRDADRGGADRGARRLALPALALPLALTTPRRDRAALVHVTVLPRRAP